MTLPDVLLDDLWDTRLLLERERKLQLIRELKLRNKVTIDALTHPRGKRLPVPTLLAESEPLELPPVPLKTSPRSMYLSELRRLEK